MRTYILIEYVINQDTKLCKLNVVIMSRST